MMAASESSKRVRFIEARGRTILYIDFSEVSPDEFLELIGAAERLIAQQPPGSVLTLTNVDRAKYDKRVAERLKSYVAHNKPFVRAGAVVGLNELRKIVFNFLNRTTGRMLKAFDDIDAAKAWLAAQTPPAD